LLLLRNLLHLGRKEDQALNHIGKGPRTLGGIPNGELQVGNGGAFLGHKLVGGRRGGET